MGVLERGPVYIFLIQVGKLWFCPLGNNFASVCACPRTCVLQDGRGCLQDTFNLKLYWILNSAIISYKTVEKLTYEKIWLGALTFLCLTASM